MRCSFCGFEDSKVLDSRPVEEGKSIRRRRECQQCGKRFTTYERLEEMSLVVVKRDGSRELFDANKILNGLIRSCDKRTVPIEKLEEIVIYIEKELRNSMEKEVFASDIAEMLIKRLRYVDEVAYVRFVSVYRKFEDIDSFMREIQSMIDEPVADKK